MADPLDPPLRVDWIRADAIGDGRGGDLGLTSLPGKRGASARYPGRVYRRDLDADLARLARLGVGTLILLVEDHELERWGDRDLVGRAAARGLSVLRWPVPDGAAPSLETMLEILEAVRHHRRGGRVAVACMGGVGRTGTVAACALVQAGWPAADAIAEVRRVRHPMAVETSEQEAFVRSFADDRAIADPDRTTRR